MRFLLFMIILIPAQLIAQSSLYDITIKELQGKNINMADYKGKKIIVAAVSADNLQNGQLAYLDSIQVNNPSVIVIAVPAADYRGANDSLVVDGIKKKQLLHIIITAAEEVKKDKGHKQNRLINWLTALAANTHFDLDVTTDNQLYFISESGALYAVLEKGTPAGLINQLLQQDDIKR